LEILRSSFFTPYVSGRFDAGVRRMGFQGQRALSQNIWREEDRRYTPLRRRF